MLENITVANYIYWFCYAIGFVTIFVFNTLYARKFGVKPIKALLLSVVSYVLILLWAYVLSWIESKFAQWGHHNAIRVYIWMPVLLVVLSRVFKINWRTCCDFIAPSTCIVYAIARFGCNFTGCCYGIEMPFGIYSRQAGHVCFPVQLCESIASLLIAIFALKMNKKKNYKADAETYFLMLIPYGFSRFLLEFFADNNKLFWGISSLALHALAAGIVGTIAVFVIRGKAKKR